MALFKIWLLLLSVMFLRLILASAVNNMVLYTLKHMQKREVMLKKSGIYFISKLNIGSSLKKAGGMTQ